MSNLLNVQKRKEPPSKYLNQQQQQQQPHPESNRRYWIYHERQEAFLCGQHALNNLVQRPEFTPDALADIAQNLDEMEKQAYSSSSISNGQDNRCTNVPLSGNVDETGNFSIQVLHMALSTRYDISLCNILQHDIRTNHQVDDLTVLDGFICNKNNHWFAIRKIRGRFWKLDSMLPRPTCISHFHLAAELESIRVNDGYSVFCVLEKDLLPSPCSSDEERKCLGGSLESWWREEDLIAHVSEARNAANDHWRSENVGTGIRLDGKNSMSSSSKNSNKTNALGTNASQDDIIIDDLEDLSEDELLQIAMDISMAQQQKKQQTEDHKENDEDRDDPPMIELLPEPAKGQPDSVLLQFRLPDGTRKVRSFLKTELVGALYTYVRECCPDTSVHHGSRKSLELLAGFPPRDLKSSYHDMLQVAKLSGESIQCRYHSI